MPPFGLILLLFLQQTSTPQIDAAKLMQQAQERAKQAALQALQDPPRICYAIRSYIFKRQDGSAPVLVKTTTCTEVMPRLDRVSEPPKVKLVPAVDQ